MSKGRYSKVSLVDEDEPKTAPKSNVDVIVANESSKKPFQSISQHPYYSVPILSPFQYCYMWPMFLN